MGRLSLDLSTGFDPHSRPVHPGTELTWEDKPYRKHSHCSDGTLGITTSPGNSRMFKVNFQGHSYANKLDT